VVVEAVVVDAAAVVVNIAVVDAVVVVKFAGADVVEVALALLPVPPIPHVRRQ
jgi:hypothetical protein